MKRLSDQALILEAVKDVRKELEAAVGRGESSIEINKIMLRLATLYALLDVHGLLEVVVKADTRKNKEAA